MAEFGSLVLSIKWHAMALAHAQTCQYLFWQAIITCAELYMMS